MYLLVTLVIYVTYHGTKTITFEFKIDVNIGFVHYH